MSENEFENASERRSAEDRPGGVGMPQLSADEVQRRYAQMADTVWSRGEYAHSRTRDQLDKLLNHGHPIPMSRGITKQYVAENYPGWTWNGLVAVLQAAEVFVGRIASPPYCDERVIRVDFDSPSGWRVLWDDGTVTRGPVPPGLSSAPEPRGHEVGAFSPTTGRMLEIDDDGKPIIEPGSAAGD